MLPEGTGALFRAVSVNSKHLSDKRGGYGIFRGAANWVGEVVGQRDLAYKDIARRVAITKLCNSGLPQSEVAAYLGVRINTLDVYFRSALNIPNQAANILSVYAPNPKVEVDASSAAVAPVAPVALVAPVAPAASSGVPCANPSASSSAPKRERDPPSVPDSAGCVSAFGPPDVLDVDAWDYEEYGPLTQLSERTLPVKVESSSDDSGDEVRGQLESHRRAYKRAAYAAPATPPGALVNQDLSDTPDPFVPARKKPKTEAKPKPKPAPAPAPKPKPQAAPNPKPKPKPASKPKASREDDWHCCFICDTKINPKHESIVERSIQCDGCMGTFHLRCAN